MKDVMQTFSEDNFKSPADKVLHRTYQVSIIKQSRQNYFVLGLIILAMILMPVAFFVSGAIPIFLSVPAIIIFIVVVVLLTIKRLAEQIDIELDSEKMVVKWADPTTVFYNDIIDYQIEEDRFIRLKVRTKKSQPVILLANSNYCETKSLRNFVHKFDAMMTDLISIHKTQAQKKKSFFEDRYAFPVLLALTVLVFFIIGLVAFYKKTINAGLISSFLVLFSLWARYFSTRNKKSTD